MASGGLPVSRRRPSSAETPPPEDDPQKDDGKLPALPSRPLSSSSSRARNARQEGREERRSASQELTLVPIDRGSAGNSPSPQTTDVSSTSPDSKGRVSEADPRDRDLVLLDLKEHVERLEQDLKLTSDLLRQANRELSRKDAAITRLNRHNDRLRGKVVRLESDVAVYKASAASSSDEDSEGGDGGHVCCVQDREVLKALTSIYSKMQKTDGVRKDSDRLPDAKLVEQVFAKFWQDYLEVSRELESCKQMVAYQELKIQDLEAARVSLETNHRGCQSEAERTVKAQKLAHLHRGRQVSQTFLLIDDLQQESQPFRDGSEKKDQDAAPASKEAGEERKLRQCVNRLQLDNNRLVVLNKEISAREAATKRELQRVQTKLSSFKSDLAKATKRVLGRESSCVFPTEVSLGILLDELVALRRQNVQLRAFQQREIHQQRSDSTAREKSRGGLQPVPEEAAADWTSATWPGDVTGRRVDDVLRHRRDVIGAARSVDTRSGPIGQLESRATSDAISPEVPEADYRIWFPRADTKPPEEWRTFSEYRYTECSRGDVLEKTLSVEQVFEKDRKKARSDHQESSLETVRCLTTPNGNVQVSRDQVLSRKREEGYKEHSSQLTRFDVFPEVLQKSLPVTKAVVESADESKVSCQRFCKGFSYSGRDFEGDMLTLKPPLLESEDDEFEVLAPTEPPLGFQDGSFVSVDDEFDVRKSTYIKIDSVDAIVQDCAMEGVIIRDVGSDDLGDIVEEAEEEVEQLETGEFSSSQEKSERRKSEVAAVEQHDSLESFQSQRTTETLVVNNRSLERANTEAPQENLKFRECADNAVDSGISVLETNAATLQSESPECATTLEQLADVSQPAKVPQTSAVSVDNDMSSPEIAVVADKENVTEVAPVPIASFELKSLDENKRGRTNDCVKKEGTIYEDHATKIVSGALELMQGAENSMRPENGVGCTENSVQDPPKAEVSLNTTAREINFNGDNPEDASVFPTVITTHLEDSTNDKYRESSYDNVHDTKPAVAEGGGVATIQVSETPKPAEAEIMNEILLRDSLGESLSASIEANLLKDVMEMNRNDDETSQDVSFQEDAAEDLESLPDERSSEGNLTIVSDSKNNGVDDSLAVETVQSTKDLNDEKHSTEDPSVLATKGCQNVEITNDTREVDLSEKKENDGGTANVVYSSLGPAADISTTFIKAIVAEDDSVSESITDKAETRSRSNSLKAVDIPVELILKISKSVEETSSVITEPKSTACSSPASNGADHDNATSAPEICDAALRRQSNEFIRPKVSAELSDISSTCVKTCENFDKNKDQTEGDVDAIINLNKQGDHSETDLSAHTTSTQHLFPSRDDKAENEGASDNKEIGEINVKPAVSIGSKDNNANLREDDPSIVSPGVQCDGEQVVAEVQQTTLKFTAENAQESELSSHGPHGNEGASDNEGSEEIGTKPIPGISSENDSANRLEYDASIILTGVQQDIEQETVVAENQTNVKSTRESSQDGDQSSHDPHGTVKIESVQSDCFSHHAALEAENDTLVSGPDCNELGHAEDKKIAGTQESNEPRDISFSGNVNVSSLGTETLLLSVEGEESAERISRHHIVKELLREGHIQENVSGSRNLQTFEQSSIILEESPESTETEAAKQVIVYDTEETVGGLHRQDNLCGIPSNKKEDPQEAGSREEFDSLNGEDSGIDELPGDDEHKARRRFNAPSGVRHENKVGNFPHSASPRQDGNDEDIKEGIRRVITGPDGIPLEKPRQLQNEEADSLLSDENRRGSQIGKGVDEIRQYVEGIIVSAAEKLDVFEQCKVGEAHNHLTMSGACLTEDTSKDSEIVQDEVSSATQEDSNTFHAEATETEVHEGESRGEKSRYNDEANFQNVTVPLNNTVQDKPDVNVLDQTEVTTHSVQEKKLEKFTSSDSGDQEPQRSSSMETRLERSVSECYSEQEPNFTKEQCSMGDSTDSHCELSPAALFLDTSYSVAETGSIERDIAEVPEDNFLTEEQKNVCDQESSLEAVSDDAGRSAQHVADHSLVGEMAKKPEKPTVTESGFPTHHQELHMSPLSGLENKIFETCSVKESTHDRAEYMSSAFENTYNHERGVIKMPDTSEDVVEGSIKTEAIAQTGVNSQESGDEARLIRPKDETQHDDRRDHLVYYQLKPTDKESLTSEDISKVLECNGIVEQNISTKSTREGVDLVFNEKTDCGDDGARTVLASDPREESINASSIRNNGENVSSEINELQASSLMTTHQDVPRIHCTECLTTGVESQASVNLKPSGLNAEGSADDTTELSLDIKELATIPSGIWGSIAQEETEDYKNDVLNHHEHLKAKDCTDISEQPIELPDSVARGIENVSVVEEPAVTETAYTSSNHEDNADVRELGIPEDNGMGKADVITEERDKSDSQSDSAVVNVPLGPGQPITETDFETPRESTDEHITKQVVCGNKENVVEVLHKVSAKSGDVISDESGSFVFGALASERRNTGVPSAALNTTTSDRLAVDSTVEGVGGVSGVLENKILSETNLPQTLSTQNTISEAHGTDETISEVDEVSIMDFSDEEHPSLDIEPQYKQNVLKFELKESSTDPEERLEETAELPLQKSTHDGEQCGTNSRENESQLAILQIAERDDLQNGQVVLEDPSIQEYTGKQFNSQPNNHGRHTELEEIADNEGDSAKPKGTLMTEEYPTVEEFNEGKEVSPSSPLSAHKAHKPEDDTSSFKPTEVLTEHTTSQPFLEESFKTINTNLTDNDYIHCDNEDSTKQGIFKVQETDLCHQDTENTKGFGVLSGNEVNIESEVIEAPIHKDTVNRAGDQTNGSTVSENFHSHVRRQASLKDDELSEALEQFSYLVSMPDSESLESELSLQGLEKKDHEDKNIITDVTENDVIPEEFTESGDDTENPRNETLKHNSRDIKEHDNNSIESCTPSTLSASGAGDSPEPEETDDGQHVKVNSSYSRSEDVERSSSTRAETTAHGIVRSIRTYQKTVLHKESTRTVRKVRSLQTHPSEKHAGIFAEEELGYDVSGAVPDVVCAAEQAFQTSSIPRQGLSQRTSVAVGPSTGVQATPSTSDQQVQTEFAEHDCVTRLVELQIAMNEQEEVRRQDMKAACELVEKLEAMQISESLMRTQIDAMDSERKEMGAREARMKDELKAWQETVQQQQLLLQQLKEDLDDTEDALSSQRRESNRLREQLLVLQASGDTGIVADVLNKEDKGIQTPDDSQQHFATLDEIREDLRRYKDQLQSHRRMSAQVSSQLEATASRIALLKQDVSSDSSPGQDYADNLTEKEVLIQQLMAEQQQLEQLLLEQDQGGVSRPGPKLKQALSVQTEEEKLSVVGARCLHENHPEVIARQAQLLRRLQREPQTGSQQPRNDPRSKEDQKATGDLTWPS